MEILPGSGITNIEVLAIALIVFLLLKLFEVF